MLHWNCAANGIKTRMEVVALANYLMITFKVADIGSTYFYLILNFFLRTKVFTALGQLQNVHLSQRESV